MSRLSRLTERVDAKTAEIRSKHGLPEENPESLLARLRRRVEKKIKEKE